MSLSVYPANPPLFGSRNVIRNGDISVRQRGNGGFTSPTVYTADGWIKTHVGGTHSVSVNAAGLGIGGGLNGAPYTLQSVVAAQAATTDYAIVQHKVEGVRTLAGKSVTLSFIAFAASGTPSIGVELTQNFGTGGSPSADVNTAIQAVAITTTETRYTVTFTVPSIVGKVLGTNANDYLTLQLWISSGSNNGARSSSIGIQNATIDITDVQLEEGSSATPFERLPQQMQLVWCQRYFWRAQGAGIQTTGQAITGSRGFFPFSLPVQMRVAPTWTVVANGIAYSPGATAIGISYISNYSNASSMVMVDITFTTAPYTPGQAIILLNTVLDITAEL